jgi:ABC-type multidrug transport system fused ATPase/permease subunit
VLTDCPENSISRANTFAWILLVIFMGVIATCFYFLRWKQRTEKYEQRRQVEQMRERELAQTAKVGTEESIASSKALGEAYEVEFKDINLTLPNGTKIMQGVHGKFSPGRLCAIMGSSGAGKTTIINLITGKVPKTSGQIYVNGVEKEGLTYLRKITGFVPQEDTMIRSLTVRENIKFSAQYRLDASTSAADLDAAVNETLLDLGIEHVQHTIIGDEMT